MTAFAQPFFSIIIPTYERPMQLAVCLEALAQLDYPRHQFEVIVVDDGSRCALDPIAAFYTPQLNLTLLHQSNAGPAAARNAGAQQAQGSFLVFTDDDCAATPYWLDALAARCTEFPDAMVGGRSLNALPSDPLATASQVLTDAVYTYFNANSQDATFFPSNNLALPAEGFRAIGGFDPSFPLAAAEDRDFCDRWLHAGQRMIYDSEVVVYHAHALTLRQFWQQHFNYGRGAFHFRHVKAHNGRGSVDADIGFYLHLLRYPFTQVSSQQAIQLEGLLLLSYVAKTAGFIREKITAYPARS